MQANSSALTDSKLPSATHDFARYVDPYSEIAPGPARSTTGNPRGTDDLDHQSQRSALNNPSSGIRVSARPGSHVDIRSA